MRAKVRVGLRQTTGRKLPSSIDYFVSEDAEFHRLLGEKPRALRVWLPYDDPDAVFPTGLEWWRGKQLACFTDDGSDDPIALRLEDLVDKDDVLRSDKTFGRGRKKISCRFNDCPHFGHNADNAQCKPKGRLQFFVEGFDPSFGVYQFSTGGWATIRGISAFLSVAEGDLTSRPFELTVGIVSQHNKKFPVVSLREVRDGEGAEDEEEEPAGQDRSGRRVEPALRQGQPEPERDRLERRRDASELGQQSAQPAAAPEPEPAPDVRVRQEEQGQGGGQGSAPGGGEGGHGGSGRGRDLEPLRRRPRRSSRTRRARR